MQAKNKGWLFESDANCLPHLLIEAGVSAVRTGGLNRGIWPATI
jgi:hypothetical protein